MMIVDYSRCRTTRPATRRSSRKMSKDLGCQFAARTWQRRCSLMAHPAACFRGVIGARASGLPSQAFGFWAGTVAGAAEASQRLFMPLAPRRTRARGSASVTGGQADVRRVPSRLPSRPETEAGSEGRPESRAREAPRSRYNRCQGDVETVTAGFARPSRQSTAGEDRCACCAEGLPQAGARSSGRPRRMISRRSPASGRSSRRC